MVDLTGLGAFFGSVPQGYDAAQARQNQLRMQQQQIQDTDRKNQAMALLLSGIGGSQGQAATTGLPGGAPPQGMPPQGPQGAPMPMAPQSAPMQPGAPGPMPQPGPQGGAPPMGGPAPPQAAAMPIIPTPQAPNFEQQLQAMAQKIKAANPGADPAAIGEAVMAYAKLVQTDDSRETKLLALQMQLQNRFDTTIATLQSRMDIVQAQGKNRETVVNIQQGGANQRSAAGIASREGIAAAAARLKAGQVSQDDIESLAQARAAGDTSVIAGLPWGSPAKMQVLSRAAAIAKENGATLAEADAAYGGTKAAAATVGRTAGSTAVGAAEIGQLKPLIMGVAQRVNTSQFPTVNAVENAVRAGTGNPDIVQLRSYIQTLRNAYQQIAARGGRMTDQVRRYGEELVNGNMPIAQLSAAADAMANEATVIKGATGTAMKDVTSGAGPAAEGGAGGASPAPGGNEGWGVERVQ